MNDPKPMSTNVKLNGFLASYKESLNSRHKIKVDDFRISIPNEKLIFWIKGDVRVVGLDGFKTWLKENQKDFLKEFLFNDVDDQGEGEYRDIKSVNWFDALDCINLFQVESYINEIIK